ncbi:MAG TPA: hypothetical protein VE868_08995, partial [Balneolaceae bacterium]|nr:hypothetical protein [Balneolaceae bacterium]
TSYVPVWLKQDQLHIAKQQIPSSLKHELVHVLAKQFGNKLFNASWSIGLVEGLAVAISGHESPVATINQIVKSEKPYPTARQMKQAFSPWGFYGGRSAVNYTQSGSFVQYLLQNYPIKDFKHAYRTGDISQAYPVPFKKLVAGWHSALDTVKVDSTAKKAAAMLYSIPSLFQQKCPHVQSAFARHWDQFHYFMAIKDTAKALTHLNEAIQHIPDNHHPAPIESQWAYLNLKTGHDRKVRRQASLSDTTSDVLMLYADAFAMNGESRIANKYVDKAAHLLLEKPDSTLQQALYTREHQRLWKYYRAMIYHHKTVSDSVFNTLDSHTRVRAIQQAIEQQNWNRMERYASVDLTHKIHTYNFDTYLHLIEWLAYEGNISAAKRWSKKVQQLPLRARYRQRLGEAKQWIDFLDDKKSNFNIKML